MRFFSPPEKPSFTARLRKLRVYLHELHLGLHYGEKIHRIQLFLAPVFPHRVVSGLEEINIVDPGDFHRILERQEHAITGALLGCHGKQILAKISDAASGDFVALATGERCGRGALAGAVGAHDRMYFAGVYLKV